MLKRFFSFSGSNFLFNSNVNPLGVDSHTGYSFNTPLANLFQADICLLFDVNLRISLPLLNSRLKQLSNKKMLPVFVLGFYSNYNYFVKHVGNSKFSAISILEGSH
jgi:NADH dehydrogenase/NADH:ubiquinone oxidoreductase subunit G